MTTTSSETLITALRRFADEGASGLLAIGVDPSTVVVELDDGRPVAIGPTGDGEDAAHGSTERAATIDGLVDEVVAAVVAGDGAWSWDVDAGGAMLSLPPGLAPEFARRAVDAAQALATVPADRVLHPGRPLAVHGQVGAVRDLIDGERTLADVAAVAGLTVPATATLAAALLAAGVVGTGEMDPDDVAVVAAGAEDALDDEPGTMAMDDVETNEEPPTLGDDAPAHPIGAPDEGDRAAHDGVEAEEPELWVMDDPEAPDDDSGQDDPDSEPRAVAGDDAASEEDWDDAEWLEELGIAPDGQVERVGDSDDDEVDDAEDIEQQRSRPRAEPGKVAEFLRELSDLTDED